MLGNPTLGPTSVTHTPLCDQNSSQFSLCFAVCRGLIVVREPVIDWSGISLNLYATDRRPVGNQFNVSRSHLQQRGRQSKHLCLCKRWNPRSIDGVDEARAHVKPKNRLNVLIPSALWIWPLCRLPALRVILKLCPRGDAGGLSREYVPRIPSVS